MLESLNSSPKIAMKVRATHEIDGVKRKTLKPFIKYYEYINPEKKCFFCGEKIEDKELSLDHIIPWSFMFSDDIWNLVFCHRSENSSKSNSIPTEEIIRKLEDRNKNLLEYLEKINIKDKKYQELKNAINHDYVRKFWIASRG